jgi:uncharacterized membrane protein (UPF0127 family)
MSNKTQKNSGEKIESAPKTTQNVIILILLAALILVVSAQLFSYFPDKSVKINGQTISVEVVDTPAERERGLSGRESLGRNQGMLFVFSDPSEYCLWMKDMKFPIDMIWLDEKKQVLHIQESAQPDSYPESFCPPGDAKYILEVPAGSARAWSLTNGDQAVL